MESKIKDRILIVEDNELNRMILEEMLQDEYRLLFAENGQVGIDELRKHYKSVDVVLLDLEMPVMNGYQFLEVKSNDPSIHDIPVIITTAADDTGNEIHCLQLGASDFVRKPYDPVVVKLRVENIINLRQSTEANRQKSLFIQNMSHEIRTPMNAIMGFSQVLETPDNGLDEDSMQMCLKEITTHSRTLMGMIDNMLLLNDFDSRSFNVIKEEVALNEVCAMALEDVSYSYPEGVNVHFTTDAPDDYTIVTDGKNLQQALVNLVHNACKFTQEGEINLHCSLQAKPGWVTLSVTDTGIGVPADKAEDVLKRFYKIDAFVPGLGLGLNITRKIARFLDGTVYLDTSYDQGARFVLEIPLVCP